MPKKSKTLLDHANDLAADLADKIGPQVEHAVDAAREKAGPVIADARDKAGPIIADARGKAAPAVQDARDRINADVIPALAAALAAANEATEDVRGETAKRGKAAVAALKGEVAVAEPKKKHRFRKFLLVLGLGGAAAFVARKLSDRPSTTTWESNYTPSPAPAAPTAANPVGSHKADPDDGGDDAGGASPDVAAADAAAEPHAATTPDNPAETIDVKHD